MNSDVFEISVKGMLLRYRVCPGVYPPSEDTFLLLESVVPGKKVLEIGCGSGILSVFCAKFGSGVMSVDINPLSLDCTEMNARLNSVVLGTQLSDIFENVEGKYDTIIFNPPYLPSEDDIEGSEQWNGGKDGFKVTQRFLDSLGSHLTAHGESWIILSSLTDIQSLIRTNPDFSFEVGGSATFFMETLYSYKIILK